MIGLLVNTRRKPNGGTLFPDRGGNRLYIILLKEFSLSKLEFVFLILFHSVRMRQKTETVRDSNSAFIVVKERRRRWYQGVRRNYSSYYSVTEQLRFVCDRRKLQTIQ
jgi:hypothetical protein